jgi:prophage antirepressor-like protein
MYKLQTFQYNNNPQNIVTDQDGNILFDASHVCAILGYEKPAADVVKKLDDDEKILVKMSDFTETVKSSNHWSTGPVNKWFIYESGLYKLIIRSNKPEAKVFTRWVTHEVLPAIRKTGSFQISSECDSTKPDLVKINKTHKASYEMAIREGKSKIEARKQAAKSVKQVYQVDIYELLDMEPPKSRTERENALVEKIVRAVEKLLEKYGRATHHQVLQYSHLKSSDLDVLVAGMVEEGLIEERKSGSFRWYFMPKN